MELYSYFRSSAAYRVRIALALKQLDYTLIPVHLVNNGGEHRLPTYQQINPQQLVPALQLADGTVLTQSLAIMEYLEEAYPNPALLPSDSIGHAKVRALAQIIAADIHPLNNLRVLTYLSKTLEITADQKTAWYQQWVVDGFRAIEALLPSNPAYCYGDSPSLADCCLIPQVYNAKRFDIDLADFPKIRQIDTHCMSLPAFIQASPEQQVDAV